MEKGGTNNPNNSNSAINNESKTFTVGEASKSGKSSKSAKKKREISTETIILSLERDISDLLLEITIRAQRNKLISMSEDLKMLNSKISSLGKDNIEKNKQRIPFQRSTSVEIDNITFKKSYSQAIEADHFKSNDLEIKKLKEEIATLQSKINSSTNNTTSISPEYDSKLSKKEEALIKLNSNFEQTNLLLNEERNRNNILLLQITTLEDALKTLNSEYNTLSHKFGIVQNECDNLEKVNAEMKKTTTSNKYKFEDLIKINTELKDKIIKLENTLKLHMEDIKSLLKKNSSLQKIIDDLENKNKTTVEILKGKEQRLEALRLMNSKMEQKSNQILNKWEAFHLLEEKNAQLSSQNQRLLEVTQESAEKLLCESMENQRLKYKIETVTIEKEELHSQCNEYRNQLSKLKAMNEDLIAKNTELENKFKISIQRNDLRESLPVNFGRDKSKMYCSGSMTNLVKVGNCSGLENHLVGRFTMGSDLAGDEIKQAKIDKKKAGID